MMSEALADVKFGFVLRNDVPVNRVATPTKLSSYLSAGVIPVFSKYLKDFIIGQMILNMLCQCQILIRQRNCKNC